MLVRPRFLNIFDMLKIYSLSYCGVTIYRSLGLLFLNDFYFLVLNRFFLKLSFPVVATYLHPQKLSLNELFIR